MALGKLLVDHRKWMKAALREADRALEEGEVPVGAVVVHRDQIVGRGHNMVERLRDPTAHAEVIAITAACDTLNSKFLKGCTLYVTLEPCPMCAGSLILARLDRLVFGAFDEKAGAAGSLYDIPRDSRLNHVVESISGVEAEASAELLQAFFQKKRQNAGD
ncbi:MAG: tRNA adenosine(34) deaminase TadA [Rhodothermia bacterium]|nr:MAG: tRNA adenosine(34) deaminase TadA [Rhodothermia bacterium]